MEYNYKIVLEKCLKSELDTDYGVLNGFWEATRQMIKDKAPRAEILKFLRKFRETFGEFKMIEARGDFIDANLI